MPKRAMLVFFSSWQIDLLSRLVSLSAMMWQKRLSPDGSSSTSISKSPLLPRSTEGLEKLLMVSSEELWKPSLFSHSRNGGVVLSRDPVRVSHRVWIDIGGSSHPKQGYWLLLQELHS